MAKATSLKLVSELFLMQHIEPSKKEVLANVRKNVEDAVRQLRSLGSDYEKAAWMLEDSLSYALADKTEVFSDDLFFDHLHGNQGVDWASSDWASLIQAEELFEASR